MSGKGRTPRLLVVGAGVVGLSTAVQLQTNIPGSHMTVMADKFTPETTSDGAAGVFRPTEEKTPETPLPIVRKWLGDSWDYLSSLARSGESFASGVFFVSGCQLLRKKQKEPLLAEFVEGFRELSREELANYPGDHTFGWTWKTVICENKIYLPYLTKKFLSRGGTICGRKLQSLAEIEDDYDVIVNCAAFGNSFLTQDTKMVPIRGHILKVEAPWVKNFLYHPVSRAQFEIYIVPGRNTVTVGGTRMEGDEDVTIRKNDSEIIWNNALAHMPALKGGQIVEEWVGLRPHRTPLRLETEVLLMKNGKRQTVVHNYGHGAEGVSLAWGTALNAVQLVQEALGLPGSNFPSKL